MNKYSSFNSVEIIPQLKASAAFTVKTSEVFKEQEDTAPVVLKEGMAYMPWGAANDMPYRILELIESDETLSTCQLFNAEVCYGSGLVYDTKDSSAAVKKSVGEFLLDNDLAGYFLGVCQDFKHFAFAVSVIILNADGTRIVRIIRKHACYCRFAPAKEDGTIEVKCDKDWGVKDKDTFFSREKSNLNIPGHICSIVLDALNRDHAPAELARPDGISTISHILGTWPYASPIENMEPGLITTGYVKSDFAVLADPSSAEAVESLSGFSAELGSDGYVNLKWNEYPDPEKLNVADGLAVQVKSQH